MAHRNARLTPHGRLLLVDRVRSGQPVSHVAKAMGVSRQCAHRWIKRFNEAGVDGLEDRSSRPHTIANQTPAEIEEHVVAARRERRCGPDQLAPDVGVPARTITRILRRNGIPRLHECDPLTGEQIRASKTTALRYERDRPGELVHVDVKKLGRIPNGGGWRAHGRQMGSSAARKKTKIGFDYVHSMVDDHTRIAYSEIHPDERGDTCGAFIARAGEFFASLGISIERVMTDNHWSYKNSHTVRDAIANLGATHKFIRPHCPWQNGKVERFNRTLQTEWAYHQVFDTNNDRAAALPHFLHRYNHERRHHALGGQTPISRLTPT
ncbi:MAG: IS481 family transposase [Planctomycetota bacterium]